MSNIERSTWEEYETWWAKNYFFAIKIPLFGYFQCRKKLNPAYKFFDRDSFRIGDYGQKIYILGTFEFWGPIRLRKNKEIYDA